MMPMERWSLRRFLVMERDALVLGAVFGSLVTALVMLAWLHLFPAAQVVQCPPPPAPAPVVTAAPASIPAPAPAPTRHRANPKLRDLKDPFESDVDRTGLRDPFSD
jgi:hypothetical protein